MKNPNVVSRVAGIGVLISFAALTLLTTSASAQTFSSLYQFTGPVDGENPIGALALDSFGNLYGTTRTGGALGFGTVSNYPVRRERKRRFTLSTAAAMVNFPRPA